MNTLTIVVLVALAVFGFIGHSRGLMKMLFSVVSLALTLYVATLISPQISKAIQETSAYDTMYETTYKYVCDNVSDKVTDNSAQKAVDELPLPEALKIYIISSDTVKNAKTEITAAIATKLTAVIFDTLVFIITFLAALIIVKLISGALDIMTKIPIIHGMNQILGLFVGIAEGLLFVWIFFLLLNLFSKTEFAIEMFRQINESKILSYLYNNNIIVKFLWK